jgi:hypothetical protein
MLDALECAHFQVGHNVSGKGSNGRIVCHLIVTIVISGCGIQSHCRNGEVAK